MKRSMFLVIGTPPNVIKEIAEREADYDHIHWRELSEELQEKLKKVLNKDEQKELGL